MQIGSRVSARGRGSGGQELCAGCTAESVHLFCEQHRSYFVCLRVCEQVAAALSGGGERPQKQLCFMAKAYRTIKTEAVCCTALCVAD